MKTSLKLVVSIVALLIVVRLVLPTIILQQANDAIDQAPGLTGSVRDIDLALWRGAYQIEGTELYAVNGDSSRPLLKLPRVDITLLWSSLLQGELRGALQFDRPILYLQDAPEQAIIANDAIKDETTWITLARDITPFILDRILVHQGSIRFIHKDAQDTGLATFEISQIALLLSGLTNQTDNLATLKATGMIMGQSKLSVNGQFSPFASAPTFDVDVKMERLATRHLDDLINSYAYFDVEGGQLDMAMELNCEAGMAEGYIKGGIYDIDIFSWKEDVLKDQDDPISLLLEGLTGAISELFENDKTDMVATRIPLEGQLDNLDVPLLTALAGLFRNAFVRAYEMKIEDLLSFEKRKQPSQRPPD